MVPLHCKSALFVILFIFIECLPIKQIWNCKAKGTDRNLLTGESWQPPAKGSYAEALLLRPPLMGSSSSPMMNGEDNSDGNSASNTGVQNIN